MLGQFAESRVYAGQHRPQPPREPYAGLGQGDAARGADQQLRTDPLLQDPDRVAERGRGDFERRSGASEVQVLGQQEEGREVLQRGLFHI